MKGVIFDFDNTLIRSQIDFPALKIAMGRLVKKYGLDFGPEEEIPQKYTAGNIIEEAEKFDGTNGTELAKKLWEIVVDYERKGMEKLEIEEGAIDLLEYLNSCNFSTTLFTNNSKKPTLEVLKRYKMNGYFSQIIAREDVKKMKPDEEGINLILQLENLEREKVVFVGDSWVDGKAALNAGIKFILFRKELLDETKYEIKIWKHVKNMKELKEVFHEIITY